MFARVTRFEGGSAGEIDESVRIAREKVLPAARELEGFKGLISLADRSAGSAVAITFWETEDALRASEERANQLRRESLVGEEEIAGVDRYEVTMFELGTVTATATG
jgi:heme-degrading monooxygenase HmoA